MLPQLSHSNESLVMRAKRGDTNNKEDEMLEIPSLSNVEEQVG